MLDAIVVTWNKYELSLDCIEHLLASTVPVNVVVVDNGSSDDTPRRVRERFPAVEVIELPENVGFGPGANRGIAATSGEFVAVVNSDANVAPDYFERVLDRFAADELVGVAAGLSMNPATGKLDAAGASLDRGLGYLPYAAGGEPDAVNTDDPLLAAPCSDAMVFRRSALDGVGLFDEEIFAYWEDVDLMLRVQAGGWSTSVASGALVWHIGSAALGKRSVAQLRLAAWGRGYIAGRYRIHAGWLALELVIGAIDSLRLRSHVPLTRRVAGWRHGRSLPPRVIPGGIEFVNWRDSLRSRFGASR